MSAEYIFSEVLKKYVKMFASIEDEYLRDRVGDIKDIGHSGLEVEMVVRSRKMVDLTTTPERDKEIAAEVAAEE